MHNNYHVYDFFCGCGGASEGLRQAGMDIQMGVDADPNPLAVFSLNHPAAIARCESVDQIGCLEMLHIMARRQGACPDVRTVFVACPPCQPYSKLTMQRHAASTQSMRGGAMDFIELVEECFPDAVLMENVPQFVGTDEFVDVVRALEAIDYGVQWRVFNLAKFGVPQYRWRMVMVAVRFKTFFEINMPTEHWRDGHLRTVRDAIGHFPAPDADHDLSWHVAAGMSELNMARIQALGECEDYTHLPPHLMPGRIFSKCYSRLPWDSPAPTLTGTCNLFSCGPYGHPRDDRHITLREAATLQSFPTEFDFAGKQTHIAKMIGNAFPPLAARAFADVIVDAIEGETNGHVAVAGSSS